VVELKKTGPFLLALLLGAAALLLAGALGSPSSGGAAADPSRAAASANRVAGCQVFPRPGRISATARSLPDQRAWNQRIDHAPVDRRSGGYINYINTHGDRFLHPDFGSPSIYGIPYKVVSRNQPRLPIRYTAYGDESDRGPFPIPLSTPIEGGPRSDGDRHVIVLQRGRCHLFELYNARPRRGPKRWLADSGVEWNLRSSARHHETYTSADAAGLPVFPGLIRFGEVQSGHINHAIRVTFDSTQNAYIHPAVHCAGDTSNGNAPPMGLRFRLKPGYNINRFTGAAEVIARALKQYGFINADNGTNWYFQGAPNRRWNDDNLNQLKSIPGSAFQVVRSQAPVHRC
jgi:hypothetical protein